MPNGLTAKDSIIGFSPKNMMFFAIATSDMSRNRAIVALLAPFFFLSIVPTAFEIRVRIALRVDRLRCDLQCSHFKQ
jgi:hypothetical protein